eukprot:TRINITY_DN749_c0_g1_i1.p1 TRINITY_DN749_c0_g1~~TRINITY_DN749_c0_g1_i1.p1  ORF type:complete len:310 (-),score=89.29 TRINITY_DN749_c0_g1_i1:99-1028(-)
MERGIKDKIVFHYDELSTYYNELWGGHIHHGFWITGQESKEEAQKQLILELVKRADLKPQMRILDVGCGIGGTSIYLAQHFNAQVVGITISPVQVSISTQNAIQQNISDKVAFALLDGEKISFSNLSKAFSDSNSNSTTNTPAKSPPFSVTEPFDIVWISEALSHFSDKRAFFNGAYSVLRPNGKVVIADWFKRANLDSYHHHCYITPIEQGMLLPQLNTPEEYAHMLRSAGFNVLHSDNVSDNVKKTWDITIGVIAQPALWKLAWEKGGWEVLHFMKTFQSMREGFANGTFIYSLIVAQKPSSEKSAL